MLQSVRLRAKAFGYSVSCSADMGNIEINGSKMSNDFEREGNDGRIDIDSDLGNVTLKYLTD